MRLDYDLPRGDKQPLHTAPTSGRTDPTELAPVTAWRRLGATESYLLGALRLHGASTAQLDLLASWDDPVDDLTPPTPDDPPPAPTTVHREAHVDTLPLPHLREGYLAASGEPGRAVGYYDPEHDQIAFVRWGERAGEQQDPNALPFGPAAPRHQFRDTQHHQVSYTAVATSRYREYFPPDQAGGFTRSSLPLVVDVPASERPVAPSVAYVLPTFGWERQIETNLKRSVRFGGGLRVYLHRPWWSSGAGELLGVALWSYRNGSLDEQARNKFKPFITQWGMDPIWETQSLAGVPNTSHFPGDNPTDLGVSLEEATAAVGKNAPGRIDVVGFPVEHDAARDLWYADLTINMDGDVYMPFVRLALVRYQPHALADAKVSRVVLADFAQLTPGRAALVTADPHHPHRLHVVISGVAPRGPKRLHGGAPLPPVGDTYPTQFYVRVQERNPSLQSDLAWRDVASDLAQVRITTNDHVDNESNLALWDGTVTFKRVPEAGRFRLLIEEYEFIPGDDPPVTTRGAYASGRIIYTEAFELDAALIREE